jgi:hypothetical protein
LKCCVNSFTKEKKRKRILYIPIFNDIIQQKRERERDGVGGANKKTTTTTHEYLEI